MGFYGPKAGSGDDETVSRAAPTGNHPAAIPDIVGERTFDPLMRGDGLDCSDDVVILLQDVVCGVACPERRSAIQNGPPPIRFPALLRRRNAGGRQPLRHDPVSYTHLRAHETRHDLVCRLLLEKKKK